MAFSIALEGLYGLMARILRLSIIASSEGEWLRSLVAGFGMRTYGGSAAIVEVEFSRINGELPTTIPAGTRVGTSTGKLFRTIGPAPMAVGQTRITTSAIATRPGAGGGVLEGEIVSIVSQVTGITSVRNLAPSTGGHDPEADSEIKARLPGHIESLHRATIPATEYAIATNRELYPEVKQFYTRRNYGTPGYLRGVLVDYSGGDLYRAEDWIPIGSGIYSLRTNLDGIKGLAAAGWPGRRFGIPDRELDGREVWQPSRFINELEAGTWRFLHDRRQGLIYAKADGQDLNELHITIYAGIIWRVLEDLELHWVANGVHLDIIAPYAQRVALGLSYELERGYDRFAVEQSLRAAVAKFFAGLEVEQALELEALYADLAVVPGAAGILVDLAENLQAPADTILRLDGSLKLERRAA